MAMKQSYPHRGITMHQLPVGSNFPAVVFTVGSALIFLIAIPALWYVTGGALVLGLLIAAGLRFVDARKSSAASLNIRKRGALRLKEYR
jgi:hypothetical protein